MAAGSVEGDAALRRWLVEVRHTTWRLITATVGGCFRYRVTGLAAEAAFFAILSLPPLIFGLAGTIGYIAERFQVARVAVLKQSIIDLVSQALTEGTVQEVIEPTLDDVLRGGRIDVISIGFVLALWSGSRALNVFIDTITIMYGLGGRRGIVKTRALSFTLYIVGLAIGMIVVPLILAGPELVRQAVPDDLQFVTALYWPTVLVLSIAFLTSLYHLSVPVRTSWFYDIPGAVFAVVMWILGSWLTRWVLQETVGGTSIYGPLSAPIAILLWLYVLSIAVLIGAALNAAVDRVYPARNTARARLEVVRRLRERTLSRREQDAGLRTAALDEDVDGADGGADGDGNEDPSTRAPSGASGGKGRSGEATDEIALEQELEHDLEQVLEQDLERRVRDDRRARRRQQREARRAAARSGAEGSADKSDAPRNPPE